MLDNATLERDMVHPAGGERVTPRTAGWRAVRLVRAHPALVLLLLAGAAVRVAVMVAYPPAFGYYEDTRGYLRAAENMVPSTNWPFGYSVLLKVLSVTGHIVTVAVVQHLLGLALGVGVYALLRRRGLPRTWSAVAAAPVLLDARQIVLEHFVLSETLFTALVLGALMLLLWRVRPTTWMCAVSGLALASAALTRTVGQALIAIVLVYLLVRRVGWRQVAAFVVAAVLPIVGYMGWYHHHHGVYALNEMSGRYLWQRTTTFVDCSRKDFTADELKICPPEPIGQRPVGDMYIWVQGFNDLSHRFPSVKDDPVFAGFARKAILGQPVDYARTIARDGVHMFQPGWQAPRRIACTTDRWSMPSGDRVSGQLTSRCKAVVMPANFQPGGTGDAAPKITALNGVLWAYGQTFVVAPLAMLLVALFALGASCWRPRKVRPRDAADAVLLSVVGLALVVLSLALAVIDVRYTVPLLTILPPAAALAWHRLRNRPGPADGQV